MAEWKNFPLWEPRPADAKQFKGKERAELELTIARQVSDLLSRHGSVTETEVDISECVEIDEPSTFLELRLDEFPLEDDGDLAISQMPFTSATGAFITDKGVHAVNKTNEDGALVLAFTVWDPEIDVTKRVHDMHGKTVGRMVLQELHEALALIIRQCDAEDTGNMPPLTPHEYPTPLVSHEFEALIAQLEQ